MKRIFKNITIFSTILILLSACSKNEVKEPFHQLHERVEAKGWKISLDQATYTEERDQDKESVEKILRLKITVKNIAAEEQLFDTTKLRVTDSKGKDLKVYPYENMVEKMPPKQSLTGYSYFIATEHVPYRVSYTYPITKDVFTWEVTPDDK
ncbi:hypothetical protein [Listeria newyorkensis]|uniref:DUF4352 domain-containing protein n=1 Tax=Listeria newyorkensis TaxID=1497681 RepID=A0A841YYJ5_9LIST|nr:hypothetical protein [Listeria newyorkensis]MBC1458012.1 hypothetical protein [Listeria newyorkensis]